MWLKSSKKEIAENRQQISYTEHAITTIQKEIISKENVETPNNGINIINKVINKKWLTKITLKIEEYKFEAVALIDSSAI